MKVSGQINSQRGSQIQEDGNYGGKRYTGIKNEDLEMRVEILVSENETLGKIAMERGREIKKRDEEIERMEESIRKLLCENEKLNKLLLERN